MKVSEGTKKALEGVKKELVAGMSIPMPGQTDQEKVEAVIWNNAHRKCISIVEGYIAGNGLFV